MKLLGLSLAYFMVLLDTTVLAVAEPSLVTSLGASVAALQWVTTAYTVVFAALLLSAGALSDRLGAGRVFRGGVALFGLASLGCAAAPDLAVLIGLRAVLGLAAAACVPSSLALLARLYPDRARYGRAVAVWAAVSGAAVAAGPVIGGLLVAWAGWRAVFLINAPLAVVVLACTVGLRVAGSPRRVDAAGQALAIVVLALLTDAVIAAGAGSWLHAGVAFAGFLITAGWFARREHRTTHPVLPPQLVRSPAVRAALLAGAAVNFTLTGALFVLPLLLAAHGLTPALTGLALAPLTLPFAVNPPLTAGRIAPGTAVRLGLALLTLGGLALAAAAPSGAYPALVPGLLLTGLGVSFALPALVVAVVRAAPPEASGAAGGILNAARQTGATLGAAAMGAPLALGAHRGAMWAFLLAAAVCTAAYIDGMITSSASQRATFSG
jgi:DHA2 family methylenomycin A resistance protein-like MFS transporter